MITCKNEVPPLLVKKMSYGGHITMEQLIGQQQNTGCNNEVYGLGLYVKF